jgi:hypothetical protein
MRRKWERDWAIEPGEVVVVVEEEEETGEGDEDEDDTIMKTATWQSTKIMRQQRRH